MNRLMTLDEVAEAMHADLVRLSEEYEVPTPDLANALAEWLGSPVRFEPTQPSR